MVRSAVLRERGGSGPLANAFLSTPQTVPNRKLFRLPPIYRTMFSHVNRVSNLGHRYSGTNAVIPMHKENASIFRFELRSIFKAYLAADDRDWETLFYILEGA